MFKGRGQALLASAAKRLYPSSSMQALSSAAEWQAVDSPSALYIPAKYCNNTTPTVIPYYDLSDLNIERMQLNLKARGMESQDIVLERIVEGGRKIAEIECQLAQVSKRKTELSAKLKEKDYANDAEEEFHQCKAAEKDLNRVIGILEENCILKYLNLPNGLHPDTPLMTSDNSDVPKPLYTKGAPKTPMKPHQELCQDDLTFTEHGVYMSGPLASLELSLSSFVQDQVLEDDSKGFEMVVGTDFTRSVIVEGCHPGSDVVGAGAARVAYPIAEGGDVSDVHGAMGLHLVGSASIYTFVSQLVKLVLFNKEALPKRQICLGRNYKPVNTSSRKIGSLFEIPQTTSLEAFTASRTEQEMGSEFDMLVETLKSIYDELDCHYRMSIMPAHRLDSAQSKRVVVEMAAAADLTGAGSHKYVEVANAAIYGDFLSKRLMLLWKDGPKDEVHHDLHIASGTLMNVTKVVGCLVENQGLDHCLAKLDEF